MDGHCARVTCANPAVVLLVFDPRQTWARLYDYDRDDRRVGIALCAQHGDAVSVPAGWTIVDDRTSTPHLAPVPADGPDLADADPGDPESGAAAPTPETGGTATAGTATRPEAVAGRASSPTLWSVDEPTGGADDDPPDHASGRVDDARPGDEADEHPLAEGRDPGDDLDVDESTPLLSRAFRAAHVD